MRFSGFSIMKKKTHFPIRSMVEALCVFLLIFTLNGVDGQADGPVMADLQKSLAFKGVSWSGQFCTWQGIQCSSDGRVTRIQIKDVVVTGSLPPNLNSLSSLQHLEFRGNQVLLSGALPTLKGLSSLQEILLSGNNFSSIPADFFDGLTSLQSVAIDNLPLSPWQIPESLMTCSGLVNFSASSSNVVGKIPEFINGNNFPGLVGLRLSRNKLEGGLPSNFSTLTTLQLLWLGNQNLNGSIGVIQNMTSLVQLWLNMNSFNGPLPEFSALQSLSDLSLRDNQFTGPIPPSLITLASLRVVNLTNNLFQGPLPVFDKAVQVDNAGINSFCPDSCSPDVLTMLLIAKNWGYPQSFAGNWKGNSACGAAWLGISCSANGSITGINFKRMDLVGTISPSFAALPALTRIDLSDNRLYGTIPVELTKLPLLKQLDVSNNDLSGKVPSFNNLVIINTTGNPSIGLDVPLPPPGTPPGSVIPPPTSNSTGGSGGKNKKSVSVGVIVGAVLIAIVGAFLIGLAVFCVCKKKGKSGIPNAMVVHPHHSGSDPDMVKITVAGSNVNVGAASETYSHTSSGPSDIQMVESGNMVIAIQVLRNVTNNFSEDNVLGRGGFGTVYKGELHDGTKIAVKRMESGVMGSKGLTEFKSEIDVLNKVRHRHLVSLQGYCLEGNERILVYEYMPQGTLSEHLFNWKDEGLKPLGWTRRLCIALDVARGVEYLHGLASQSFIHRDLKPSNILLGDDMRAKVADFGLVRLAPEGKASIETRLAGTFGYLAPEYAATGRVTTKVDVYAFGVILMELITGRKALDESQPEESMHLVTWFRRMSLNKDTARKAIDPTIDTDEEALASISTVSELAGYCCSREPHQRPDMGHVVNVLSSLVEMWKPSNTDPDDIYAIDMDLSLAQTLKKWQDFDGDTFDSSFVGSLDNTQTSIPTRPSGFAESFTSADGR